jgi:hypothetical protein
MNLLQPTEPKDGDQGMGVGGSHAGKRGAAALGRAAPGKIGRSPRVRLPRIVLLPVCAGLTGLAYYLILFTNIGNVYHGGTFPGTVMTQTVAVFAVFSCIEVMRTERVLPLRALAGAVGVPLVLVTLLTLWYGVRRYGAG